MWRWIWPPEMNDGSARIPTWWHRSGTEWKPKRLAITVNEEPIDLTGAYVRMRLVDRSGATVLDWMSDDHPNAEDRNGVIDLEPDDGALRLSGPESGVLTAAAGDLFGDLKIWRGDDLRPVVYLQASLTITAGTTP